MIDELVVHTVVLCSSPYCCFLTSTLSDDIATVPTPKKKRTAQAARVAALVNKRVNLTLRIINQQWVVNAVLAALEFVARTLLPFLQDEVRD